MSPSEILLDAKGHAISPIDISKRIIAFGNSYSNAIKEIINNSKVLVVLSLISRVIAYLANAETTE